MKTHGWLSRIGMLAAMLAVCASALAQVPEVDTDSVLRRGNHVERIGGHQQSAYDAAVDGVTGPPADDSGKWFITIITQRGCVPCAKLKAAWAKSAELLAFARPGDTANSWAHYNEYEAENRYHEWFTRGIAVKGYPTILIQPPATGKYGDARFPIYQATGFDGDAAKLASSFTAKIKGHLRTLNQHGALPHEPQDFQYVSHVIKESGYGQRRPPLPVSPSPDSTTPVNVAPPTDIPGDIHANAKPVVPKAEPNEPTKPEETKPAD